jgi:xanthine dehydrogenase accessory factor
MRDILIDLKYWLEEGKSIALATVIQTWGSSPRVAGSKMAITLDGKISGSVSGGCVENAVIEAGVQSLKTNQPQLLHFGVADETAWEVGLACGGSIDVFVKPLDKTFFSELNSVIAKDQPAVTVTVVRGPDGVLGREFLFCNSSRFNGCFGNGWDEQVADLASEILIRGTSQRFALSAELEVFFEALLPPPTLIVVGGVHITVALTSIAKTLGYRTIVVDPRKAWGNVDRFPHVDKLIRAWPEAAFGQIEITRSTAIAMLTHDPKLDDPALRLALSSPAFYVGALGSKSTDAKRRERLLNDGLNESQLSRLHAPIGLDIGALSPEEIALAIMAEVVEAGRKRERAPAETEAVLHPVVIK